MRFADRSAVRIALPFVIGAIGIGVGWALAEGLADYVVFLTMSVVTAAIAVLGLGIVTGSAGMIALCQLTFAAIGAWVVCGMNVIHAPGGFLLWLVVGAAAAGVAGILIGLPALRLRGVNLAVVTLGFAAAADVTLVQIQFPGSTNGVSVERPASFVDDRSFLVLSVIVLVVCCIAVYFLQHSRWGSGWRSVAFSERGTAAVGSSVAGAKLTAFAVSAALGGVSGGLIAGQVQLPFASSFSPLQSLALYVLAVMSGAHLIDMAIFAGILWVAVPQLLQRFGIPQDWGFVIFGALGVQALAGGGNLGQAIRNLWWKRRATRASATLGKEALDGFAVAMPSAVPLDAEPVLVVENLTVEFGKVKALNDVSLTVHRGEVMGLIGPNGAGKSTFVDAITGFLPRHTGSVVVTDIDLRSLNPMRRARLGVRRTFQQDRVPPSLTIDAYLRFVARTRPSADEVAEVLHFFGCPPAATRLSTVDVGTRRLVEVAAGVLARPHVLLLDEPAAGLSHEEHVALGNRIAQLPARFGIAVVLIEHDLDMVRSVCATITVLDFGQVLASGSQADVLADPAVLKAYMGETELL